jgi:Na+-driven multidrug efflux pump
MHQTKADFLVQKYRQILRASLLVEAVSYIMTMTDTLIAGNMIGEDALAAAGLVAPLLTVTTFIASVINSGTLLNYSYCIGRFEERRAHEYSARACFSRFPWGRCPSF